MNIKQITFIIQQYRLKRVYNIILFKSEVYLGV